jgi:predicted nucleotidyltransferase
MEIYRLTARRNKAAAEKRRRQRVERGWSVAGKAADLLRKRFHAERIIVFGSLLRPEYFDERSDVDLAVSGVADSEFLRAVAAVTGIDGDMAVDLIQIEQTPESLRKQLESGVAI